jgi:serine/threonine-protein kinase
MPHDEIPVGEGIGDYRVTARLATGTYRAHHTTTHRRVHIEVAERRERWRDAALRMLRTSQMLEAIHHPGIAPIVARGVLPDHRHWLACEVPNGIALADLMGRRELSPFEIAGILHDLADVLAFAHERGLVHRALTIDCVVIATGARGFPLTISGWGQSVDVGVYMAPEGADGDGRIDVYALGIIGYRAATGEFPSGPIIDIPGIPAGLAMLLARMLAKDPDERPSAAEVRGLTTDLMMIGEAAVTEAMGRTFDTEPELQPISVESDDVVGYIRRRFATPRWTPAPPITSEVASIVAGEIFDKTEKV